MAMVPSAISFAEVAGPVGAKAVVKTCLRELLIQDLQEHREIDCRPIEVIDAKGTICATYYFKDLTR